MFTLNDSRKASKELKPVADLVREIIRPSTNPLYEEIRSKPSMLMTDQELELSHANLREELKRANKFLTRLVERQLVLKSVEQQKAQKKGVSQRGASSRASHRGGHDGKNRDKVIQLLQMEINNAN